MSRQTYSTEYQQEALALLQQVGLAKALATLKRPTTFAPTLYRWRQKLSAPAQVPATSRPRRKLRATHGETTHIRISVPAGGICLKLDDGKSMIGTLQISTQGLKFSGSNAKTQPARELSYRVFSMLMTSGFGLS